MTETRALALVAVLLGLIASGLEVLGVYQQSLPMVTGSLTMAVVALVYAVLAVAFRSTR